MLRELTLATRWFASSNTASEIANRDQQRRSPPLSSQYVRFCPLANRADVQQRTESQNAVLACNDRRRSPPSLGSADGPPGPAIRISSGQRSNFPIVDGIDRSDHRLATRIAKRQQFACLWPPKPVLPRTASLPTRSRDRTALGQPQLPEI